MQWKEISCKDLAVPGYAMQIINLIELSLSDDYDIEITIKDLQEILLSPMHFMYIVIDGGRIGGVMLFIKIKTLTHTYMTYENLYIHEDFRRKGLGHLADQLLLEVAKKENCDSIEFVVPVTNVAIQQQHLKNGLTFREKLPMGKILNKWGKKDPMVKFLKFVKENPC